MRGTVTLASQRSGWRNIFNTDLVSEVKVKNTDNTTATYQICYQTNWTGTVCTFTLHNKDERPLKFWQFDIKGKTIKLEISKDHEFPITYLYEIFKSPVFLIADKKISTDMNASKSSRSLEMEGMQFKHKDYESVMHFRCPEKLLHESIVIAYLLFCPPLYSNE